ncbi:MAG TPA: YfcE family phosphodiesterase [Anaerolineae bacterium]|jgi:hypothetical protein
MIGVLADSHNNVNNLNNALAIFRARGITQLIHCGDVTSPTLLEAFRGFYVWLVKGNNDYDWMSFKSEGRRLGNIQYCGRDADLVIDHHRIAACHGDDESLHHTLATSGLFEWVFSGHSHRAGLDSHGKTWLLNPGALGGRHPHGEDRSVAIIDLAAHSAQFVTFDIATRATPHV